jgi:hypothetical protein
MTSEIAAPAAGGVDAAEGLPTVWVLPGGCPDWLLPACEQAATSPAARKDTAISAAIRIPSG